MRTTINIDDDVAPTVKRYAESRSISIGKAVSELVRKGIHACFPTLVVNGIHVIDLPADSPRVTACDIRLLQEDE